MKHFFFLPFFVETQVLNGDVKQERFLNGTQDIALNSEYIVKEEDEEYVIEPRSTGQFLKVYYLFNS